MLNENAIHWIKEGLRVGKYPGSKWLADKLGIDTRVRDFLPPTKRRAA